MSQIGNALDERDAWRRRCEEARTERKEVRGKIGAVREALSGLSVTLSKDGDCWLENGEWRPLDPLHRHLLATLRKLRRAVQ
jgi:hypothetical protein